MEAGFRWASCGFTSKAWGAGTEETGAVWEKGWVVEGTGVPEPSPMSATPWEWVESSIEPLAEAVEWSNCWDVPKVLVASLPPYTVDAPLLTWLSSRLCDERLVDERRESFRARERREARSSLALEAVLWERDSERVLDFSWLMRSEASR